MFQRLAPYSLCAAVLAPSAALAQQARQGTHRFVFIGAFVCQRRAVGLHPCREIARHAAVRVIEERPFEKGVGDIDHADTLSQVSGVPGGRAPE